MKKNLKNYARTLSFLLFSLLLFLPAVCLAMPPGTLLYRTSNDGKMFGYSGDPLLGIEKGIAKHINSGHAAIYIGKENGVDYIVEALGGGIVKTPAQYFLNSSQGEKFLGAKIPRGLNTIQQAKVVALAKNLAEKNLAYDLDFKNQKGPDSGKWTCVGLTEKIYESADISNPNNLAALEYDPEYYAIDITPDGYDNENVVNNEGDCFSENYEFSKIARRTNMIIPAPEIIGYDAGLEYEGDRYIFLPYTQFLQSSLDDVLVDISLESNFNDEAIRGRTSSTKVVLRWSLINNPLSSLKAIATKVKEVALNLKDKIFTNNETAIVLSNEISNETKTALAAKAPASKTAAKKTTATKAPAKTTAAKKASVSVKSATVKATGSATKTSTSKTTESKTGSAAKTTSTAKTTTPSTSTSKSSATNKSLSNTVSKPASTVKNTVASETSARLVNNNPTVTVNSNSSGSGNNSNIVNIASSQSSNSSSSNSANNSVSVNSATTTNNSNSNSATTTPSENSSDTGTSTSSATSTETNADNNSEDNSEVDWPKLALIKRIYSTGDNDWVELYNPTDHDFDLKLAGYRLEKTKAAVTPSLLMRIGDLADGSYPGGTIIKAHDTYLIVRDDANNFYLSQADAIASRDEFTWSGNGYTLYLGDGAISSSSDVDIIDAVGFGSDATYFLGTGPALEITDNYVLTKTASTSNNANDFSLILSDEPGLISTSSETSTATIDTPNWEAYLNPEPIDSSGIGDLWHFDECYGNNVSWGVGRWGCAFELNFLGSKLSANLTPAYDLDNFSLSFNYKRKEFPRVTIDLSNSFNEKFSLQIDNSMVQIDGLPSSQWRYMQNYISDDLWHQATLVINRAEHYWALYIDGQVKIKETFNAALPEVDKLDIWTSQGRIFLDEFALWHRALSESEILSNYNINAPFSPVDVREAQKAPVLKYAWNFDEGHGSTSTDSVIGLNMSIPEGIWSASGRLNTALENRYSKNLAVNFPQSIKGKDYSLSLWWRNSVYPSDGRAYFGLKKDDQHLFGFVSSYNRNSFWFNNNYGIFHEGVGEVIPYDNLWHQLTLTYDSYRYSLNFYVDGVEKASSSLFWMPNGVEPDRFEILSESYYSEFDEVSIWEGALSPKQIKALFDNTPEFQ